MQTGPTWPARVAPPTPGPPSSRRSLRRSMRPGSSRARDYWLGSHAPEIRAPIVLSSRAWRLRARPSRSNPIDLKAISGLRPTWARSPNRSALRQGLKYRKPIREELEKARSPSIRPSCRGSADRARRALVPQGPGTLWRRRQTGRSTPARVAEVTTTRSRSPHFFLAELLIDSGRKAEAQTGAAESHRRTAGSPVDARRISITRRRRKALLAKLK